MINHKGKNNDKYHRILEAAIKIFADQGFFLSTISQIAKEAGVADGTIYLYFKNKDDILIHFFNYKARQIFDRFKKDVEGVQGAIEKLRSLVHRHLDEFQRDRNMAVVYQVEIHQRRRLIEPQIKEMSKMYLNIITEIVEQGQEEGSLRKDLYVGLVKRYIIGAIDEVINTWLHSDGQYDLSSMADPLVDLFIKGIGVDNRAGNGMPAGNV
jgi:TetR/AcrR family fatty acid metabolism transcriptional regulator